MRQIKVLLILILLLTITGCSSRVVVDEKLIIQEVVPEVIETQAHILFVQEGMFALYGDDRYCGKQYVYHPNNLGLVEDELIDLKIFRMETPMKFQIIKNEKKILTYYEKSVDSEMIK